MDRLVVGSRMLNAVTSVYRDCGDLDIICRNSGLRKLCTDLELSGVHPIQQGNKLVGRQPDGTITEIEIAWPGSTGEELIELVERLNIAPKDMLLALKLSHRYKKNSPHFLKTMQDIQALRAHGAVVIGPLAAWRKRREKETLDYGHPKLDLKSGQFFTDNVPYKYVHDTIHLAMARNGVPAYKLFQADGAEVKVDRAKWNLLSDDDKLASVIEEAYVLALERHQIPNDFRPSPDESFKIALEKVCTSIASGWWREWAWEHYDDAIRNYDHGYVDRCRTGIDDGTILPYTVGGEIVLD